MAECVMEDGTRFAIPQGTELLAEQVGGHEFIAGKQTMSKWILEGPSKGPSGVLISMKWE